MVNPNFISPRNFMMRLIKCTDEYAAGVGTYYTTSKKLLDTGFWLLGMLEEDSKKLAARDLHELLRCWENYHRLWTVRLHMQQIFSYPLFLLSSKFFLPEPSIVSHGYRPRPVHAFSACFYRIITYYNAN